MTGAKALQHALLEQFTIEILYVVDQPAAPACDLLHVFFWGETWHQRWQLPREQVCKEVSSHRWNQPAYGNLTPREFALLEHLMLRAGQVVTRTQIEQHIYDDMVSPMSNVVDSAVCALRRKIATCADAKPLIHTRRGQGYVMEERLR